MQSKIVYSVNIEICVMLLGKILEISSEGSIDVYGLVLLCFVEKCLCCDLIIIIFNCEQNKIIFIELVESFLLQGGEQDCIGIIWQFVVIVCVNVVKLKLGLEWNFFVVGLCDVEQWIFKVVGCEKIKIVQGEIEVLYLFCNLFLDDQVQKFDIWLVLKMEWYLVCLKFIDFNGDYIEQVLDLVKKIN